jgi:hypothetical protein
MRDTIFPESSTAEDWTGTITFTEDSDGSDVDLSVFTGITMKAWDENGRDALSGTLTGGELINPTNPVLSFTFTGLSGLKADRYTVGITATDGISTRQLLRGYVTFYDGMNTDGN